MTETMRGEREEKVIEALREWLPHMTAPGATMTITALDPESPESDGALFLVTRAAPFVCRRGGGR